MTSPFRPARAYAVAVLAALASVALSAATVKPLGGAYLYLPLIAVFVSALHGGLGPGLLAVLLCTSAFDLFFLGVPFRLGVATAEEAHRLAAFALFGAGASWIASRFRAARREAESARHAAERASAEARRIGELQERLVAVVSHDLRNPIAALRGNLDLCARLGPFAERQERALASMRRTVARMEGLVSDLLDVARTRQGMLLAVTSQDVRLGEVCARTVAEIRDANPDADVALEVDGDDRAALDPRRMAQLVSNLVANALQHGGGRARVRVSGLSGEVVLEVENEGSPIPPELAPHLFEPFRRGRNDSQGLGLGLFVVREIARAHGGRAAFRSEDRRTIFEVRLPRGGGVRPPGSAATV